MADKNVAYPRQNASTAEKCLIKQWVIVSPICDGAGLFGAETHLETALAGVQWLNLHAGFPAEKKHPTLGMLVACAAHKALYKADSRLPRSGPGR